MRAEAGLRVRQLLASDRNRWIAYGSGVASEVSVLFKGTIGYLHVYHLTYLVPCSGDGFQPLSDQESRIPRNDGRYASTKLPFRIVLITPFHAPQSAPGQLRRFRKQVNYKPKKVYVLCNGTYRT